tara:strand:- start:3924 stop:4277 length:354 start_codon:yes stop_codon:yes gene_type:complete
MIGKALQNLRPGSKWTVRGDSYSGIDWKDTEQTKPTEEEVNSEVARLQSEEPMKRLRLYRNSLLAETDWWVLPDRTASEAQLAYRQALRDLPSTATPVLDNTSKPGISGVTWPTKPS